MPTEEQMQKYTFLDLKIFFLSDVHIFFAKKIKI